MQIVLSLHENANENIRVLYRTVQFFRPRGEDGVGKGLLTVTTVLFDSGS